MKNVKNMVIAVIAMVSFLNVQPVDLSFYSRNFVEQSKKEGMGYFFERGKLREDWLAKAVNVILGGSKVNRINRKSAVDSLNIMANILVSEPLRSNPNITDSQYASLVEGIKGQINDFVDSLIN
jgi:hypothetical protein